jgi:hypothetical protein
MSRSEIGHLERVTENLKAEEKANLELQCQLGQVKEALKVKENDQIQDNNRLQQLEQDLLIEKRDRMTEELDRTQLERVTEELKAEQMANLGLECQLVQVEEALNVKENDQIQVENRLQQLEQDLLIEKQRDRITEDPEELDITQLERVTVELNAKEKDNLKLQCQLGQVEEALKVKEKDQIQVENRLKQLEQDRRDVITEDRIQLERVTVDLKAKEEDNLKLQCQLGQVTEAFKVKENDQIQVENRFKQLEQELVIEHIRKKLVHQQRNQIMGDHEELDRTQLERITEELGQAMEALNVKENDRIQAEHRMKQLEQYFELTIEDEEKAKTKLENELEQVKEDLKDAQDKIAQNQEYNLKVSQLQDRLRIVKQKCQKLQRDKRDVEVEFDAFKAKSEAKMIQLKNQAKEEKAKAQEFEEDTDALIFKLKVSNNKLNTLENLVRQGLEHTAKDHEHIQKLSGQADKVQGLKEKLEAAQKTKSEFLTFKIESRIQMNNLKHQVKLAQDKYQGKVLQHTTSESENVELAKSKNALESEVADLKSKLIQSRDHPGPSSYAGGDQLAEALKAKVEALEKTLQEKQGYVSAWNRQNIKIHDLQQKIKSLKAKNKEHQLNQSAAEQEKLTGITPLRLNPTTQNETMMQTEQETLKKQLQDKCLEMKQIETVNQNMNKEIQTLNNTVAKAKQLLELSEYNKKRDRDPDMVQKLKSLVSKKIKIIELREKEIQVLNMRLADDLEL